MCDTVLMSIPCSRDKVAKLCRKSWKRILGTPALSCILCNLLITAEGNMYFDFGIWFAFNSLNSLMHSSHNLIVLIELFVFGVLIFTLVLLCTERKSIYDRKRKWIPSSTVLPFVFRWCLSRWKRQHTNAKSIADTVLQENNIPIYDAYADTGSAVQILLR